MKITSIKNGSGGNCYTLQNEDTAVLIECGINYKEILMSAYIATKVKLNNFSGCIISHEHSDHCKSVRDISKRMKIYTSEAVIEKHQVNNYQLVSEQEPFNIGSISFLPVPVNHGSTYNLAYIIKDKDNLKLFATDFSLCKYNLSKFKFDELFIECNYVKERISEEELQEFKFARQINTHMSATNLVTHLERMDLSNCKKINLIHLSKFYADKDIIRERLSKFNIPIEFAKGGY